MSTDEAARTYEHPLYQSLLSAPGLSVGVGVLDHLLTWGTASSLWVFPMATSCCAIELMAAAASRVDLDRMGTIVRATPRQADVMVVAGTITVKMAPRVKKLWEQMPEPKWCIAMGSCAISGDFYRDLYPVVPGIDTFLPVDVYVPGCPPNPEALMHGLLRLKEKIEKTRAGTFVAPEPRPTPLAEEQALAALRLSPFAVEKPTPAVAEAPAADDLVGAAIDGVALVPADQHVALARELVARGYRQLVTIVASHFPGDDEHHDVTYLLRTIGAGSRTATWTVRVPVNVSVPSLCSVVAGADWQEREQWDLVGVSFSGHPDLRRLMMPEDWKGHPLRKDYAADTHTAPWR